MKILDVKQGSPEWLSARCGLPTASELDSIMTTDGKLRKGKGVESYVHRKLAEKWRGSPLQSFSGGVMEQGQILEAEAVPWYELKRGIDVKRVGFITTDDDLFGCSPDGLTEDRGLEIKCPQPPNHVAWLTEGVCPDDHVLQCHGGMFATGLDHWDFLSYCRGFPALLVTVDRDEKMIEAIKLAVDVFHAKMNAGWMTMLAANGGSSPTKDATDEEHPW